MVALAARPGSQPWRWQASKNTRIIDSDSARVAGGEEPREPGERQGPRADGGECASGGQAETGPALDRVAQPRLADPVEARRGAPAPGGDAQAPGLPVVRGPFAVEGRRLPGDDFEPWPDCTGCRRAVHRASSSCHTPALVSASRMSAAPRWT